jgi:zinc-ribbon domain
MAVMCARCGTSNPDGNQFCQACGTPLAVTAAQPATGAAAQASGALAPPSPPPAPGAYQSPYYAQSAVGPQPQVHRTPWLLIISAIVVLVLLMAGSGIAIGVLGSRVGGSGTSSGILPSPSPAGTPSPTVSPSPIGPGGGTASNKGVTFAVPAGWTVDSKDDQSITITNPNGDGSVTIGSGASSPPQTAEQNKETIDKFFEGKYPDTKNCANTKTTNGDLNGPSGVFWEVCFTLSTGGQSVQAEAPLFAGANSDGSVYYLVLLLTSQSNVKAFINQTAPILQSIQWTLT